MGKLVLEELLDKVANRFLLSLAAAKRARQIKEGARPLVTAKEDDYELITALNEILDKKIDIEVLEPEEKESVLPSENSGKTDDQDEETESKEKTTDKSNAKKKKRSLNA